MGKINYFDIFNVPRLLGGGEIYNDVEKNGKIYTRRGKVKGQREYNKWIDSEEGKTATDEQKAAKQQEIIDGTTTIADRNAKVNDVASGMFASAIGVDLNQAKAMNMDPWAAIATGGAGKAMDIGMKVAGALTTGDKNFSELSQAADAAVGAVTDKLMASKNPYAMLAAGGITAINELTKMGGQSVPGYQVDISSSGYGDIGQMEESSSRGFFAPTKNDKRKLDNRNEKASLALAAASISDDQSFQQEARMNSAQNVIQNNQWALNGGMSTDLLAAKHGAKLEKADTSFVDWLVSLILTNSIESAKNGTKLKKIETSEEENVIPTGTLHKNKHNLDLEEITKKGIPVIQNIDDSVETFEEIKEHESDIVQSAEIESLEIIFNKEVTDFIEERMDKYNDKEICKEVGMRVCKEILFNTKDKSDLIETINQKENGLAEKMA